MSDIIDINITPVVEIITLTIEPNLTTINVNTQTGGGGGIQSIVAGANISVNNTDANNPIVSATGLVPYVGATSDVNLGEFGLLTGNIEFDNTPTNIPTNAGSVYYNDTDGTLDLILKGGNVKLQIGQEQVVRVVNKTATNIDLLEANYQAVRVTGSQGQRLKVDLAQATNDLLSAETIGLVTETIVNNQEGFITTSGLVRNINTTGSLQGETWVDGDVLYLSPTVAGNLTKVKPIAPNHLVIIGYVIHAHITQGTIFVKVNNGYELDELHNVLINTPLNNQPLVYETSTQVWKNKTIIEDTIVDGVTDKAPSQNAVFDALDLKQDKSLSAYTVIANNTNATANGDSQTFKSIANQVYTGTPIWTGTTAPSGATTHSYSWNQIGNVVTLRINLSYANGGGSLTAVTIPLPTDCPSPYVASGGAPSTNRVIAVGGGIMQTNFSPSTTTTYVLLKTNSTNTGFDIFVQRAAANYQVVTVTVTYLTT